MVRLLAGVLGGSACFLFSSLGLAACQMDNDCAGELICENAECVAPPPAAPPAAIAPAAAPPTPQPAPRAAAPSSRGIDRTTSMAEQPPADAPRPPVRGKRHSQGMFVSGIVITSLAPIGCIVTSLGMLCGLSEGSRDCGNLIFGGLLTTAVLAGVGVPLIVIGAKREPVATARITPWLAPRSAGLGLRFEL